MVPKEFELKRPGAEMPPFLRSIHTAGEDRTGIGPAVESTGDQMEELGDEWRTDLACRGGGESRDVAGVGRNWAEEDTGEGGWVSGSWSRQCPYKVVVRALPPPPLLPLRNPLPFLPLLLFAPPFEPLIPRALLWPHPALSQLFFWLRVAQREDSLPPRRRPV